MRIGTIKEKNSNCFKNSSYTVTVTSLFYEFQAQKLETAIFERSPTNCLLFPKIIYYKKKKRLSEISHTKHSTQKSTENYYYPSNLHKNYITSKKIRRFCLGKN